MRLDQCFLSKQGIAPPILPHILPLTFKLFFIFTEVVKESVQRSRARRGSQKAPLLVVQKRTIICTFPVALAALTQHRETTAWILKVINSLVMLLVASSGLTGGLAAPLVAAGAATIIGSAGAAALGSTAGIAVMASLFGAAGAGLTGERATAHF